MGYPLANMEHKKSQNLQLIKYISACFVIVSHAYPLCLGKGSQDALAQFTGGQVSFGGLAVGVFFLCAGYLVGRSIEHKKTAKEFFYARVKRIFPSLWFVVFMTIIMGAFLTDLDKLTYFTSLDTWKYLGNAFLIPVHNLPGVFTNAIYNATVNGALWTLPVEFLCYVFCFVLYRIHFFETKHTIVYIIPACVVIALLCIFEKQYPFFMQIVRPCILFYIGMLFWINRKRIVLLEKGIFPLLFIMLAGFGLHFANMVMFFLFPIFCFSIWFSKKQISEKIANMGNISYGMYLVGFPIQQILVHLSNQNMSVYVNMTLAIFIASVVGFIIYYFIEKQIK